MINKKKFKFIYLEITNACNLACPFCPSSKVLNKHSSFIKTDEFADLLNKIKDYTNTVYLHLLGEPLLHPDFEKIIELCNKNNLKVRLTTNGTMLNKYDFSTIKINKYNISLQALINLNEVERTTYLKKLKAWFLSINDNLLNKKTAVSFRLWNDKTKNSVLNKQLKQFLENELNIYDYPNVEISEEEEFVWPNSLNEINDSPMYCKGGITHLGVLVNGDVVLCCLDYAGKTKLGNLFQHSLQEIIEAPLYQNIMQATMGKKPYLDLCKKCQYRKRFK